jgi:hypothetical protein
MTFLHNTQLELKCDHIETAIKSTLETLQPPQPDRNTNRQPASNKLTTLIQQRRDMSNNNTTARSQLSKIIQKEIRAIKRATRRAEVDNILHEYRDLKKISGIKSQKVKELMPSMKDTAGSLQHERQSIADIFATFYEQLYKDINKHDHNPHNEGDPPCNNSNTNNDNTGSNNNNKHSDNDVKNHANDNNINNNNQVPQFTAKELNRAMSQLKAGKAVDSKGIAAEMLKFGGRKLKSTLLDLYNSVLLPNAPTPSTWQHTMIKVLHKSGDRQLPNNYRPIATIPLLYKLFSRLLYNRLEPMLDMQQSCDQAGFRKGRSTTDHLFTITIVQEIADEWQIPLWVAAVDFKKAFDSVTHQALWDSMAEQGVDSTYTALLDKLYRNQTAAVKTDCESRPFAIERGVKQGDPLSSLLFNCVSESLMRKCKRKWESNNWGIPLQPANNTRLTNLRFADDILLTSTSHTCWATSNLLPTQSAYNYIPTKLKSYTTPQAAKPPTTYRLTT